MTVKVSGEGADRRAGFGNLQHCGSTWSCPVCSHKIAATRADEISRAVQAWHKPSMGPHRSTGATGSGRIVFATFTMRHKRGQRLDDLWENGVSAGWAKITSGSGWVRDQEKYGTLVHREIKSGKRAGQIELRKRIGFARVVETTQGANGWHVHIHALLFVRGDITGKEALALGDSMFGRWLPALTAAGFGSPSLRHGVDVRLLGPADENKIAEYFSKSVFGSANSAKVGWEAAGSVNKTASRKFGNRTPFQILADAMDTGDADDLALWWEWEAASHGKRQLTWSPWLRPLLALGEEKTDEDIASEDAGGDVVLELRPFQWDALQPSGDKLLDAVETDPSLVLAYSLLDEILGQHWSSFALVGKVPLVV